MQASLPPVAAAGAATAPLQQRYHVAAYGCGGAAPRSARPSVQLGLGSPSLANAKSAPSQRAAAPRTTTWRNLASPSSGLTPLVSASAAAAAALAVARNHRRSSRSQGSVKMAVFGFGGDQAADTEPKGSRTYYNFTGFPFPLGPLTERRTVRMQVGDGIWTFEQEQTLANISVNVRMTVIRLLSGDLWVHNPVAPTEECINLLKELGDVKYIVLGSTQYEHKVFVGPLARRFLGADVYAVPEQWSWPLDLPPQLVGIFSKDDIKDRDTNAPWADEIEQKLLNPAQRLALGYSGVECAFFHKRSKTLLCTDALVYVPENPPPVIDRQELIGLGRNKQNIVLDLVALTNWRGSGEEVTKAKEVAIQATSEPSDGELLRLGWQRDALLALFFGPSGQSILNPSAAFAAVSGKWIVGPVTYSLVYRGAFQEAVLEWVDSICEWDFEQIIPAHFAGPVSGNSGDVQRAFEVLREGVDATKEPDFKLPWPFPQPVRYREEDIQLLADISGTLRAAGVI